jgi:hypothetical protein
MKVNLLLNNPGSVRSGYVNLDPFAPDMDTSRIRLPQGVGDLAPIVDPAEATEFIALDILDRVPDSYQEAVLNHWVSRLRKGGVIAISVIDLTSVARALSNGQITTDAAKHLLYSGQQQQWDRRTTGYTLKSLADALSNRGLKILKKRLEGFSAVVVAQRI